MGKSSPNPEQLEVADLLAGKAAGDLVVAQKLAPDPEVDDDHVGFNAQQAVEKALKVALTLGGIDFPKTHDLDYLIALANQSSVEVEHGLHSVGWLTPGLLNSDMTTLPLTPWTAAGQSKPPSWLSPGAMI